MPFFRNLGTKCWNTLKGVVKHSSEDRLTTQAAALAFATVFSIAPLVLVTILIAGIFVGPQMANEEVIAQIRAQVGAHTAEMIRSAVTNAYQSPHGTAALITGLVALAVGATGAFVQIQETLNHIWGVRVKPRHIEPRPGGNPILAFIRRRLLASGMVVFVGLLLMLSLLLNTALIAVRAWLPRPSPGPFHIWQAMEFLATIVLAILLFAALYKILPDAKMKWRHIWGGATFTAAMFMAGRWAVSFYLTHTSIISSYGAAGSLIALLLWVYYSSIIFYLGAEVVGVIAAAHANKPHPPSPAPLPTPATLPSPASPPADAP